MNTFNVNFRCGLRRESYGYKVSTLVLTLFMVVSLYALAGCAKKPTVRQDLALQQNSSNSKDFFVVDCLLPGQVRNLGRNFTYMAPRRAIKTTAFDCGLRGGEYTSYDRANYKTALNIWLPQAQQGNAEAQTYVGEIYEKGLGLSPDYQLAAQWYEKAAKQGSSRAQINLGYLYEKGLGVEKDLPQALNMYRNASGLTGDDLSFASTVKIETQAKVGAIKEEVRTLQRDLEKSHAETSALRQKVTSYEAQIRKERNRLKRASDELNQSRRKLKTLESAPASQKDPDQLMQYRQELLQKQSDVQREQDQVKRLEQQHRAESELLNTKLKTAKQKARSYELALKNNQQQSEMLATKLAQSETQLIALKLTLKEKERINGGSVNSTSGERQLDEIKNKLVQREQQLASQNNQAATLAKQVDKLNLEKKLLEVQLSEQGVSDSYRLKTLAEQLTSATRELSTQQQLLEQLKTEKYQLADEKNKLETAQNQALEQKDKELKMLQAEIKREEEKHEKLQRELANAKPLVVATGNPPSIELIDPPLSTTRGSLSFKLRSSVDFRDILGSVKASAGIMSLTVNDTVVQATDTGLFRSRIKMKDQENPINITLIDKNGAKANLDFVIISHSDGRSAPVNPAAPRKLIQLASDIDFGPYHALLIGNEHYINLSHLDTPIDDVREIAKILRSKYNFKTTVLTDANRYSILSALNNLRSQLTEEDNLLIYYAGHGEVDEINQRGQWLPVDAEQNNTANWISTAAITDIINTMPVKHILVVADSCYSGAMTRASVAALDRGMSSKKKRKWLQAMVGAKSRTVLSSGGIKPVLDGGTDGHSIFARAFLVALKKNSDILEAQVLYRQIHQRVKRAADRVGFDQSPLYGPIRHTGHEAGDFFFVPKA